MAIDTGIKLSPAIQMPELLHSPWWGFAPVVLALVATAILLARNFGWLGSSAGHSTPDGMQPPKLASNELLFAPDKADKPPIKVIVTPQGALVPATWNMPPKQIIGQHYENESVELDGKNFSNCTFRNVTMMYEGIAGCSFEDCTYGDENNTRHPVVLRSGNPVVQRTLAICRVLRILRDDTEYKTLDPKR